MAEEYTLKQILKFRGGWIYMVRDMYENIRSTFGGDKVDYIIRQYEDSVQQLIYNRTLTGESRRAAENMGKTWKHMRDERNAESYMRDLALGWITEDYIVHLFNNVMIKLEKPERVIQQGSDKERKFLTGRRVTSRPDLALITTENTLDERLIVDLEVISTNRGFEHGIWMRDYKYEKIKNHENQILLIAYDLHSSLYCIAPLSEFNYEKVERYGKRGYMIYPKEKHIMNLKEEAGELLLVRRLLKGARIQKHNFKIRGRN